jgi:crotonobetainyl-CoA:carnitine CoA-transferase CaiB-like acyl-CoA transferase
MKSPFTDLKVLELASVLAGPAVGMFFAELGAQVIKFEHPELGDVTRAWKNDKEDSTAPISSYYAAFNYGKHSERVDLKSDLGQQTLHKYLAESDVVIHNFRNKDVEKMGLDPKSLLQKYPTLIVGRITGFSSDPLRVAYDVVLQAETGYMSMNGTPESGPLKMPFALVDTLAAHQLKEGILTALYNRKESGMGAYVEASLEDSALAGLINQATNYLMSGQVAQLSGSLHPNIAPYGETCVCLNNEFVVLSIGSDKQFKAFCKVIGREDILANENYSKNADRISHRAELKKELDHTLLKFKREELLNACEIEGIPISAVRNLKEVLNTPHAKKLALREAKEGVQTVCMPSVAFQLISAGEL